MPLLRLLQNKPGISYDETNVFVLFAEDWAELQAIINNIYQASGAFPGTSNLIKVIHGVRNVATDVDSCSDVTVAIDGQNANVKEFMTDDGVAKLAVTKDFALAWKNIADGDFAGLDFFRPGWFGTRLRIDTTTGEIKIFDTTSGGEVLKYTFGTSVFALKTRLEYLNNVIYLGNTSFDNPIRTYSYVFYGSPDRITDEYLNYKNDGNTHMLRTRWTFGFAEGATADIARLTYSNSSVRHRASADQVSNLIQCEDSSGVVTSGFKPDGSFKPPHILDGDASDDSVYFSLTHDKMCYKDSAGGVHPYY